MASLPCAPQNISCPKRLYTGMYCHHKVALKYSGFDDANNKKYLHHQTMLIWLENVGSDKPLRNIILWFDCQSTVLTISARHFIFYCNE